MIADVGKVTTPAARIIEANGALVTPGFIDIHTHYDGQVSWDDAMLPSANHGVTTAIMGNCGVGFAPARSRDRDTLIALMEGVEDIPGTALHEGITWEWETLGEAMGRAGKGVIQIFNDFYRENAGDFPSIAELARRSGRPLSFTYERDDAWPEGFHELDALNAAGVPIRRRGSP